MFSHGPARSRPKTLPLSGTCAVYCTSAYSDALSRGTWIVDEFGAYCVKGKEGVSYSARCACVTRIK